MIVGNFKASVDRQCLEIQRAFYKRLLKVYDRWIDESIKGRDLEKKQLIPLEKKVLKMSKNYNLIEFQQNVLTIK